MDQDVDVKIMRELANEVGKMAYLEAEIITLN